MCVCVCGGGGGVSNFVTLCIAINKMHFFFFQPKITDIFFLFFIITYIVSTY